MEKTTYQTFSSCHQPLQLHISYNNVALTSSERTKYVGVTLDRKLIWKLYIDDNKQRDEKRMILLKSLEGVRWGCVPTTLHATYRIFIKPVMTYCNAPLITVSEGSINRLEQLQNNALLFITSTIKTPSIDAVLSYTNEISMQYEIIK
ncbi:hypothetical protein NPIL_646521 [Nephila pilipes]|uniref:Uncharacterized protein n=1 Tax=Nephila pilipes TaxID=299642 RepID=A0A8X6QYT9_NEPPI|nr:hypothetical protein NPIL_646521 [Nephila pilipes]